jgi:hypothetical protein
VPLSTTDTNESVQLAQFIAAGFAALTAAGAGLRLTSSSAPFSAALSPILEKARADAAVTTREKRVKVFIIGLSILFFNFHLSICSYLSNPAARVHTQNYLEKICYVFLRPMGYQICGLQSRVTNSSQIEEFEREGSDK